MDDVIAPVSFRQGFRRGFQLLRSQRGWGTTLTLLTTVLFLVQLLVVSVLGVYAVDSILSSRAALRLEIVSTATTEAIQNFFAAVHARPEVATVSYVTKAQAYELERAADPDLIAFLDQYKLQNPFPDTFVVTLTSLDAYATFRNFIGESQWKQVISPSFLSSATVQEQQIQSLLQISDAIRSVTFFFLFVAFMVLLFLILEMVTRTAQEHGKELFLESMLGASTLTILLPIIAEMTILLVVALLLATMFVVGFAFSLPFFMPSLAATAPFTAFTSQMRPLFLTVFPWIAIAEICLMPVLAYLGTFLGTNRKIAPPSTPSVSVPSAPLPPALIS